MIAIFDIVPIFKILQLVLNSCEHSVFVDS